MLNELNNCRLMFANISEHTLFWFVFVHLVTCSIGWMAQSFNLRTGLVGIQTAWAKSVERWQIMVYFEESGTTSSVRHPSHLSARQVEYLKLCLSSYWTFESHLASSPARFLRNRSVLTYLSNNNPTFYDTYEVVAKIYDCWIVKGRSTLLKGPFTWYDFLVCDKLKTGLRHV